MRTALLVVDCLNDFLRLDGALNCGEAGQAVIGPVRRELELARAAGDPVFFACDRHLPDDAEFELYPPHCIDGTFGAEIVPELAPKPGETVLPKRRFSAFFGTDLDMRLREKGITDLRVVGVCTNICVLYSSADARMRGYTVRIPVDAVASFDPQSHRAALRELEGVLKAQLEVQR